MVGWLIAGLFGIVLLGGFLLLGGLVLLGAVALLTRRWGRHRQPADDTLIAELLGWPDVRAVPAPPARQVAESSPVPAAPAGEEDWLETQLSWIMAWAQRMDEHIASAEWPRPFYTGERSDRPPGDEPGAEADPDGASAAVSGSPDPAQTPPIGAAGAAAVA